MLKKLVTNFGVVKSVFLMHKCVISETLIWGQKLVMLRKSWTRCFHFAFSWVRIVRLALRSGCKSDAKYRPQELFTRGRGRGPHSPGTSPLTRSHSSPSSKCSTKVQRSESALAKDGHSQASSRRMSAGSSRSSRKPKHKSPSATGGRPRAESLSGSSASTNGRSVPPNKCPSQKSENRSITADQTPPPDKIIRGGQDLRKKLAKQVDRAVNSTEEVPARVALNGLEAADDLPFIDDVVDTEGNIVSPSKLGVGSASSDSSLLEASTEPHTSTDKQRTCKAGSKAESSAGGSLLTPKTRYCIQVFLKENVRYSVWTCRDLNRLKKPAA